MAGLAALLSIGSDRKTSATVDAFSRALAPRGSDEVRRQIGQATLLVRAALPIMYETDHSVLALDGIAELSSVVARYAERGPAGLLGGVEPYALIVADHDGLVLARNGDGPPLYYASVRGAVLVASEPRALLAAGAPAGPDAAVVARFLQAGACDDGPDTFFEAIRRVLPGQVVEIGRGEQDRWSVRASAVVQPPPGGVSLRLALLGALGDERTGVLLGPGLPGATLLGTALTERPGHRSLPVYCANFPGLPGGSGGYASALVAAVPDGVLRYRALPFFADELDVDGFLDDVGEPMPDLSSYLTWAIARASGGEVDVLLGAAGLRGPAGHLARLSDRVAARYGMALRFPYREVSGTPEALRAELRALADRSLPPAAIRAAAGTTPGAAGFLATTGSPAAVVEPPLREVLLQLRAELVSALLYPRHGVTDHAALARLQSMIAGSTEDAEPLWRRYVLERWLATVAADSPHSGVPAARDGDGRATAGPAEVTVEGQPWRREVLCTELLVSGDKIVEKLAWYVAEFVTTADKPLRPALRRPWHLLVAAKPVAVAQGLARAVWEIRPGLLARTVVRLGGRATRLSDPWTAQVALEHGGVPRTLLGALGARLGARDWHERLAGPLVRSVAAPREDACPPAHLAVVPPPVHPDQVARQLAEALRKTLPGDVFGAFEGCAVVGVDPSGPRLLGWSGPGDPPAELLTQLCADNPFGQDDQRTPLVVALHALRRTAQGTARKGAKPAAKRR